MGQLMDDALGIGLAAPQVGVLHRLLVYRPCPRRPSRVVNPVLEWSSERRRSARGGLPRCPACRRRRAADPVRVRARTSTARRSSSRRGPRGARHPARDRPSRRRADPRPHVARAAQAGDAHAARGGEAARSAGLSAGGQRCGPSTSARRPSPPRSSTSSPPAPHRPALVVTRPDRRARPRAASSAPPPVAERARELGIEVQPERLHTPEALARDRRRRARGARGVRVRRAHQGAAAVGLRVLNVHPSLLPRWRGAAPVERAIMAGDAETGVSIMRLTEGLDSGPVCLAEREPIRARRRLRDARRAAAEARRRRLLVRALDERPPFAEQDEAGVTYAEKIEARDRALDPTRPPEEVERAVRALRPHIGARLPLPDGDVPRRRRGAGRRRDARARRRPRARRRRPAAARLQRRRARADRGPAARRAADGGARTGCAAAPTRR